ncbi:probable aquaporin SIP2-1 isoform X2 [Amaranthus tricolor]|uniref:probable aquaporin SIP2-1 isoform X2 n=1 Tax=Amaranthus tricolor TaxID=29722 RepID=UPI00258E1D40|nr:probable aquaporin SIP2-1 isoform X2 [Amaranthus tricolor]
MGDNGLLLVVSDFLLSFIGATYNPLNLFADAISGDFKRFLFIVGARIPAQVLGAIYGVKFLTHTFPQISRGPKLNVDIHQGALTEGILTFMIVFISLSLSRTIPGSSVRKTWIFSLSKLILNILGSDLTGGCMNPASVMGWAFAPGDSITKEHILVYWLAPVEATLLAVWIFTVLIPNSKEKSDKKTKPD